jgi:hypothetical protein
MTSLLKIPSSPDVAIIINNTCNLTCNSCASLQCYNFRGVYLWSEESEIYEQWAQIADFPNIDILGGEPFLNPELLAWCQGIRTLWPHSDISVQTNGTLLGLKHNQELARSIMDLGVSLYISCHVTSDYPVIEQYLHDIFAGWRDVMVEDQTDIDGIAAYRVDAFLGRTWRVDNWIAVEHILVDQMHPNYIVGVVNNTVVMNGGGDRELSHSLCPYATNCYTIQRGLLYKCPAVFNHAEARHQVQYQKFADDILSQYRACSPYDDKTSIEKFFLSMDSSIEACSLCAFDQVKDPRRAWVPVTFDKSYKRAFQSNTE